MNDQEVREALKALREEFPEQYSVLYWEKMNKILDQWDKTKRR